MKKTIIALLLPLSLTAQAQTKITFDTNPQEYKAVGVYDTWEESPFRTGQLKGNAKVIANFTKGQSSGVANETDSIVGVQRSRFGSNTFGVRIDLKTPIQTSETTQYVHVLVNKPNTSKVMLVGLGKRNTSAFADEPNTVEQFWVESSYSYSAENQWIDMVFPVKTVTGVEIHSLVVVPDLMSPHNYKADFACYIDQIEVNSSPKQRTGSQTAPSDYDINFDNQDNKRPTQRYLGGISLTGSNNANYSYTVATDATASKVKVYNDLTETVTWDVVPGGTYTPAISIKGTWMHCYAYIDYNQDGRFTPVVGSNHGAGTGSEAVSWSAYNTGSDDPLYDSNGTSYGGNDRNHQTMPSFTIPASTTPGIYRMRFKMDWNCIDPGGGNESTTSSVNMQSTVDNGGGIVDILLNVHGDNVKVNSAGRNGAVTAADGNALSDYSHPFATELGLLVTPAPGFDNDNIEVRHGYNMNGSQYVHNNRQWRQESYDAAQFGANGSFTLPASVIDGDVNITGNFKQTEYLVLDQDVALSSLGTSIYGTEKNVELRRALSTTSYNTVVLPFDMTAEQITATFGDDAKAYNYSNTNGNHIAFTTTANGTKANVPFLLKSSTEENSFRIKGVTLEQSSSPVAAGSNYDFVGNYDGKTTLDAGLWFLSGNTFYRSTGRSTLRGYRAYFREAATGAKANNLLLEIDGVATGIQSVLGDGPDDATTYNLGGQRMKTAKDDSLPKGVYIRDSKKVVVK